MAQNYDPQNDPNRSYGINDYYQQGGQTPPLKDDMAKAKSDPYGYGQLEPPAPNIFAKWVKVITRPSPPTFASEIPDANWGTAILGALIYGVVAFLIAAFFTRSITVFIGEAISSTLGSVIGLFIGSGILYLVAKTVGQGQGGFMTQTYLYSLYTFPLAIVSSLLGLIPVLGGIVGIVISIFELFLTYYMLQPAHRMSPDKARQVVLVLVLLGVVLGIILVFFVFSLLGSRVNIVMSQAGSGLR